MVTESELIKHLDNILVRKLKFQTYPELQITSKFLNIQKLASQDQIRIDLAAINKIDSSIHFFEAELELHTQHPAMYRVFCDYCYLVCPNDAFNLLDGTTKRQQLTWANEIGVGVLTISTDGSLRVHHYAKHQILQSEVRQEVLRAMNTRFRIQFTTVPLWLRTRNR